MNGVFWKACGTVSASYFRTCDGSDNAVDVNDVELGMDFFIVVDGWAAEFKDGGVVQCAVEEVILLLGSISAHFFANLEEGVEAEYDARFSAIIGA